jgi:peptidyl-prolyl cis-trans isomerase C
VTLEQWRKELEEGLLMEKIVRQAAYARVSVDEEEIAAYFQEHPEEFNRPAQVRARQIVVRSEQEGEKILAQLQQGASFAEAARRHSLSPDGEEGGDLGFFSPGQMPSEFDAAVFSLPVGKLSPLVKSDYGFHIFLVEERREAVTLSFEAVRNDIRKKLLSAKQEQAHQLWLQELRARASIEVNWSQL